jgi:hypothetical protein
MQTNTTILISLMMAHVVILWRVTLGSVRGLVLVVVVYYY